MNEGAIQMMLRCRTCQGRGVIEDYHCNLCQQRIAGDDDWWDSEDDVMPCGHGADNLVDTMSCPACDGAGRSEQWLTPTEVKAIRRGKIGRILFVVGLLTILFMVLVGVILSSLLTNPICGFWGYGLAMLFFTRGQLESIFNFNI